MARSLNRVQLIGNLTRDPELRYTPNGTAVCSFGLATNRSWKTDTGEKHDEAEFHNIVAWNKLAEICSQFLVKGRKVFVEGRLATRNWTAQDGTQRNRTEIVISDMILLDNRRPEGEPAITEAQSSPQNDKGSMGSADDSEKSVIARKKPATTASNAAAAETQKKAETLKSVKKEKTAASAKASGEPKEEVAPDDIPF